MPDTPVPMVPPAVANRPLPYGFSMMNASNGSSSPPGAVRVTVVKDSTVLGLPRIKLSPSVLTLCLARLSLRDGEDSVTDDERYERL